MINAHELRVLVVEDHPFQLTTLEVQLNRLNVFRISAAYSFKEAEQRLKNGERYDLLLTDQHLIDGYGVDLALEGFKLGAIKSAILISGIDDMVYREQQLKVLQARGLAILAYLEKSMSFIGIKEAVSQIAVIPENYN